MKRWKSKVIWFLIVYFAGFATAIYFLAPVPEKQLDDEQSFVESVFKTDKFAQSFNYGLHRCINFVKTSAWHTNRFVKEKLDNKETDS